MINSCVTNNYDDERQEEDLAVDHEVVDAVPRVGGHPHQLQPGDIGPIAAHLHHLLRQVLKEVDCGALIEIFCWMFQHSENNSLGTGEHYCK